MFNSRSSRILTNNLKITFVVRTLDNEGTILDSTEVYVAIDLKDLWTI